MTDRQWRIVADCILDSMEVWGPLALIALVLWCCR
jgi:hypothetical protein